MSEMWVAEDDVYAVMRDLIAKHHPHLALCDDEIAILFKEKASAVGTVELIGKTSKAPAILSVLGETKWKFLIVLAADAWQRLNNREKKALLDHHLCACRVDENPSNGTLKCFVAPPDVSFYKEEVERNGFWRKGNTDADPNLIKELFGEDADTRDAAHKAAKNP